MVDQIGDGVWGLFPNQVVLKPGERYTARLNRGICNAAGNCTERSTVWSFTTAFEGVPGRGDTTIPVGFATGFAGTSARAVRVSKLASLPVTK